MHNGKVSDAFIDSSITTILSSLTEKKAAGSTRFNLLVPGLLHSSFGLSLLRLLSKTHNVMLWATICVLDLH
jgi:hypothetical protein